MFNWNEQGKFASYDQAKDHMSSANHKAGKKNRREILIGIIAILILILALAIFVFFRLIK